jgi:hypothetical protein
MSTTWRIRQPFRLLGVLSLLICGVELRAQSTDTPKDNGCPTISVTGPAGIPYPGEMVWFEVSLMPEPLSKILYRWRVDKGRIEKGHDTKRIGVRYSVEMHGNLTATVDIEGLPKNCWVTASETLNFSIDPSAILISEFSVPIASIHTKNLQEAAIELDKNPNNQMYIVEYFPIGTSESVIKRKKEKILAFMTGKLKFDGSRITLVTEQDGKPRTKIYRLPPGVANPIP